MRGSTFSQLLFVVYWAVIKRQRPGFPLATMNMAPSYVHRKIEEKYNEKKSLAVLPHLLVVFTWQLEILVASLSIIITCTCTDSMLMHLLLVKLELS